MKTALKTLDHAEKGFFLMVEGSQIDFACHAQDSTWMMDEMLDFDYAVKVALDYAKEKGNTLVVVTADHETGGLALGNSDYTLHLELLQHQKCSAWVLSDLFTQLFNDNKKPAWEDVKEIYRTQLGFWDKVEISADEEKELKALYKAARVKKSKDTETMYKSINQLGDAGIALLNKKAHIGWTTHAHSAHAVPVFAIGAGAELFSGWHDNTEIVPLIRKALAQ